MHRPERDDGRAAYFRFYRGASANGPRRCAHRRIGDQDDGGDGRVGSIQYGVDAGDKEAVLGRRQAAWPVVQSCRAASIGASRSTGSTRGCSVHRFDVRTGAVRRIGAGSGRIRRPTRTTLVSRPLRLDGRPCRHSSPGGERAIPRDAMHRHPTKALILAVPASPPGIAVVEPDRQGLPCRRRQQTFSEIWIVGARFAAGPGAASSR
jgi:hypothetical protein